MVRPPPQRQLRPTRLHQTATALMNHRVNPSSLVQQPIWYKVIESIPPSETIVRPLPPQHRAPNPRVRKASRLFQPQTLVYPEDELRRQFYSDHPWELARPRLIIEMDGKDAWRCDWSRGLMQPGVPLSGECVVQRQLWLMENENMDKDVAYDEVRRQFYALRQQEEIERRVAQEEARMVGSYFGQTYNQVGMRLEDQMQSKWKRWAEREMEAIRGEQTALLSNNFVDEEPEVDLDQVDPSDSETPTKKVAGKVMP